MQEYIFFVLLLIVLLALRLRFIKGKSSFSYGTGDLKFIMPSDFRSALVILCAAMMKMKNHSGRDEFMFFKSFYEKHFHHPLTKEVLELFRLALLQPIPISRVCYTMQNRISYEERILLMHFVYGFAVADFFVSGAETRLIRLIGLCLGINRRDLDSLASFYFQNDQTKSTTVNSVSTSLDKYYKILGVSPSATRDEIQKAYRQLAMKHHPDKVAHLGIEMQQAAKEKFQIIVDAYKQIRKVKGF